MIHKESKLRGEFGGVLAEGPHVEQGFLNMMAQTSRPPFRAVQAGDRKQQRPLLDRVRHTDACKHVRHVA